MMYKVLIVDDEEIICQGIASVIQWENYGFNLIGTAENGAEALQKIRDYQPDIVITDIKMPVIDGLELIKQSKEEKPDIEFIILSGYGEFDFAKQAMQYNVQEYLLKPCNEETILKALNHVVATIQKHQDKEKFLKDTQEAFTRVLPLVREQFLRDLMIGKHYSKEEYDYYIHTLKIQYSKITMVVLKTEGNSSYQNLFSLLYIARRVWDDDDVYGTLVNNYVVLLSPVVSEKILYEKINKIRNTFSQYYTGLIDIVYAIDEQLEQLTTLYNNLLECMKYALYIGHGVTLSYNQFPFAHESSTRNDEYFTYDNIILSVKAGDIEAVRNELEKFFLYLENKKTGINAYKLNILEYLLTLLKSIEYTENEEFYEQPILQLQSLNEVEQLKEYIRKLSLQITKKYYDSILATNNRLVRLIIQYTNEHLSNEHLSLKWLAKKYIHADSGYLSKLFVKETGQKYRQFLINLRIEKAKNLIKIYNYERIYDVAQEAGFGNNPRYFSQIFHKYVGMSPSQYKKNTSF